MSLPKMLRAVPELLTILLKEYDKLKLAMKQAERLESLYYSEFRRSTKD